MFQPIQKLFMFCPQCGQQAARHDVNPFVCVECGYTQFFSPCTAAAAIIQDSAENVLLLVRARDPGKGKFGLPGGFVDPGESVETALHREIREEVNLKADALRYLTSVPNQYSFSGVTIPVTDLFFVATVDSFEGMSAQDGEIDSWHFCQPGEAELNNMAFPSNRRALEFFLSER